MATIAEQYNEVTVSLQASRNVIRNKLVELGLAASADTLDKLALAVESIINQGAVSIQVKEGETATIPAGFHNGSGTVAGISGGGSYLLQSKSVTPTKKQQAITSDAGYYGLDSVTIYAIPDAYQDVSPVNTQASHVLDGDIFVDSTGKPVEGTMPNNGAQNLSINPLTQSSVQIPAGYTSGGTLTVTEDLLNALKAI